MSRTVLAIDRGTTQVKAGLFDFSGHELAMATAPCQKADESAPGWYEQDMPQIWEQVAQAIQKLWNGGHHPEDVAAVAVTGQGCGVFLLDGAGRPARRAIIPLDGRASAMAEEVAQNGMAARTRALTGFGLIGCSPQLLLKWVKEHEPQVYAKARYALFSKDWVTYCLTGVIGTDRTDASGAGLLKLGSREPANEIFDMLGIPEAAALLPTVYESGEKIGEVTREASQKTGIPQGVPVVAGAHDIAGCTLGSCGDRLGDMVLICGTMGVILAPIPSARLVSDGATTLKAASKNGWLAHTNIRGAGKSLDWYVELLLGAEKEQAEKAGSSVFSLIKQRLSAQKLTDILCYPYLFGEKTNAGARGGFWGLEGWHTRWDLMMSVYQGLAYAFLNAIRDYQKVQRIERIYLCGGGAKSALLCQLLADASGIEINVPVSSETTCRGGALLAIAAVEPGAPAVQNRSVEIGRSYAPDPCMRGEHDKVFQRFLATQTSLMHDIG